MKNIILYSSQLASFIGKNPHLSVAKTFNKLFDTYFKEYQKEIVRKGVQRVIKPDKFILDGFCKKHHINLRKDLDKIVRSNISTKELNLEKKRIIEDLKNNEEIKKDEREEIVKVIEGYMNKGFGSRREGNAIDYYERKIEEDLLRKIEPKRKKVLEREGFSLTIISRLDAMTLSGEVLEFKNRIYKFFEEIREYEWIQVQTYLEVYNFEEAKLIEFLNKDEPEIKVNEISRDKEYWKKILIELNLYFRTLIKMGTSDLSKYLLLSEKNQDEYIKNQVRKTYVELSK